MLKSVGKLTTEIHLCDKEGNEYPCEFVPYSAPIADESNDWNTEYKPIEFTCELAGITPQTRKAIEQLTKSGKKHHIPRIHPKKGFR